MTEQPKPIIIFSVHENGLPESTNRDNAESYSAAWRLMGLQHKRLLGCYKGECEESFLAVDTPENRAFILEIVRNHNQQSILLVDENRMAELLYLNINSRQPVGRFVSASKGHALAQDCWTFDPETETFYTTA